MTVESSEGTGLVPCASPFLEESSEHNRYSVDAGSISELMDVL